MAYQSKDLLKLCAGAALATFMISSAGLAQITCSPVQYVDGDGFDVIGPATTSKGIVPERCEWSSGDAGHECVTNLGYDFGHKIDPFTGANGDHSGACDGQGSCELAPDLVNTITISNSDGTYFDWSSSPFDLGAVVVKGSNDANVFTYDPADNWDTGLYSPLNPNSGNPFGVSHATFCWNEQDGNGGDKCYEEETAWAVGDRWNRRGSWAMYVDFAECDEEDGLIDGVCTRDLRAGGGDGIGTDVGYMTLTQTSATTVQLDVLLENGAIFYYDLNSVEADDNLKVFASDRLRGRNPKIGRFANKISLPVGSTEASMELPFKKYYGIHLDVAVEVPCEP